MFDEDQDIIDSRIEFLKGFGLTVKDKSFFKEKTTEYGYHEIFWQYADLFFIDPNSDELELKHPTDFSKIYDKYLQKISC